jgi:hypothetical protein
MTISNNQKKILAVLLTVTFPIWIVPVLLAYVIIVPLLLVYAGIADSIGVK